MRACPHCRGTGKLRTVAAVGAPSSESGMDARSAFEAEVRPGDFVVCGSDYAQMLAGELGVAHTRERVLSDAEIVQRADVTVDLAPRPETLPPLRGKPADVKPAAPATPAVHAHEPEPVTERESLIPRRKSGK